MALSSNAARESGSIAAAHISTDDSEVLVLGHKYWSLPTMRYINTLKFIFFCDLVTSLVLWICGGDSAYFISSIIQYQFTTSVFDVAVVTTLKCIILIAMLSQAECEAMSPITSKNTDQAKANSRKRALVASAISLSLSFFVFGLVKGGLILNRILNSSDYQVMHSTYNALAIATVAFGLLEVVLTFGCIVAFRRLNKIAVLHRINENGEEVDELGNPVKKGADLKRLLSLAKPEARLLSFAILCLIASSAATMVAPLYFGKVVDSAKESLDVLNSTVIILFGIYTFYSLASMARAWLFELSGQRLVARLRKQLLTSIIKQEVAFFDVTRTGELTNRLSSDTQVIQSAVTVNMSMLLRNLLQIIGSLVFMFVLSPSLTGVMLAVVPIISYGAVQYGTFVKNIRKKYQDSLADAGTVAEECISSIRTVRAFAGEDKASAAYSEHIDKTYETGKKLAAASGVFQGLISLLSFGAITLALWYGGKLVHDGELSVGVLTAFLVYTIQIAGAFAVLTSVYGEFMQAVGASVRMFELVDRKPIIPHEGGIVPQFFVAAVQFKNVTFTYPSRPESSVIKGMSLKVEPGKVVALVGPSGGGKSTVVSLIERFYDPDSGHIMLSHQSLKDLDPRWFRQNVSLVSQEPTLFACSIRENIAYGCSTKVTEQQIIEAAKQANAHDFITSFGEGYDTVVGERGVRLSGGQKQRVAIARALVTNPSILLLDEATSALDAESEHLVQEAIDRAMVGRTVLVIAHRLSTVRNASQVIVINKGEIAEIGTHDELLAKDGVYKRLVIRQLTSGTGSGMPGLITSELDKQTL